MKLTPLDIRHKEFKRGMRGYADVEVDEFLDEVADEYERLFKENIDLRDRVEALEEKVAGYKRIEETLQKTLVNAQASAEEQKQNASKQAQLILQDAELKARQMANEAYTERQAIEQSMAKLKSAQEDFRFTFRQMLEGYLRQLGDSPEAEEPAAGDFARHAEAIKEAIARESTPAPVVTEEPAPASAPEPKAAPPEAAVPAEPAVAAETTAVSAAEGILSDGPRVMPQPDRTVAAAPAAKPAEPETTLSRPAPQPVDPPEAGVQDAAAPGQEAPAADTTAAKGRRVLFGEADDLLADVDGEVNENEFKW